MNAVQEGIARDYCEVACRFASKLGIGMRRQDVPGGTRILLRFAHGEVVEGEWRNDPRHALVAACKLLPL